MSQYVPQDFYGEQYLKSIGFWANHGQVIGTDGSLQEEIKFYSEGGFPRIYAKDKSKVSFVIAKVDTNSATVDTLHRLDLRPFGPHAREVAPTGWAVKDWIQNFYMRHCGTSGVEEVGGFSRILYTDIFPSIDMHFYSGSMGQKMALVMRPGCNISDLKLAFNGQDSMKVDLWGNLKLFYNGKEFVIPFVQAYQINSASDIVPLSGQRPTTF